MVAAGSQHSLALTAQGQLLAWGEGLRGRLGLGTDETKHVPTPVKSMEGKRIVAMAAGNMCYALLLASTVQLLQCLGVPTLRVSPHLAH
mmetsp:Transcript_11213/g.32779  ORF Transcript_11213/g.32779 Transcript_11213/m.32779 type:complete len:89 (+) Transcript_11213:1125-1391(+)